MNPLSIASFLVFIGLLLPTFSDGQTHTVSQQPDREASSIYQAITLETDRIFNKLIGIRRKFHEHPELAGLEKQTQETIKQYLLDLGLEVRTDVYGYGVVGILKGAKPGKQIAWRAEMDAISNDFPDQVDFRSKVKGVQHGCGHDVHMAIALGMAEVLAGEREQLCGTVIFIFQPEEEVFAGAKGMVEKGLFTRFHPAEIYGLHVTALPAGQIMVKPNEMYAYQKKVRIKLKNKLPEGEVNALAKKIHARLSRAKEGSKPWEIKHITDSSIGIVHTNTIYNDYLIMDDHFFTYTEGGAQYLEAYVYETHAAKLQHIIPEIKRVITAGGYKDELLSVTFVQENPTVMNDQELTAVAIKTLDQVKGNGFVARSYGQVPYFNDDFAYFQQRTAGVYFFLGGSDVHKGIVAMNHAPHFEVDEACIRAAVQNFSYLLLQRLTTK